MSIQSVSELRAISLADMPLRIGVSSCLLGENVRYNGSHKRHAFVAEELPHVAQLIAICPEVAIGLGTPRAPIRLVGTTQEPRAVGIADSSLDVTDRLTEFGRRMGNELQDIFGYIVKKDSPSCGMERVKLYNATGNPNGKTRGIYTNELIKTQPLLPVEEEGRLSNDALRESFLTRIAVYYRWRQLARQQISPAQLIDFHTRHKMLLLAHSEAHYRRIGKLLADLRGAQIHTVRELYIRELMDGLTRTTTRKKHSNVLSHLLGFLKGTVSAEDRQELARLIDGYRAGDLPREAPMTSLRHHVRRHPLAYLNAQFYLFAAERYQPASS